MDGRVLELVLFLAVENYAIVVHEIKETGFPEGTTKELH